MRIVIAGAGQVGSHLARLLSNEDQEILIIDSNPERLAVLDAKYNIMTVAGNPASFQALRKARTQNCDLFIGVMPSESHNIVACSMAKSLGAKRTVARIENYDFMDDQNRVFVRSMGVDNLIYPEYLAAQQIASALRHPWVRQWFEILNGEIIVVGVRIHANASMCGMRLMDFASAQRNFHVSAIRRGSETLIPRGSDRMEDGDILYITVRREDVGNLISITGKTDQPVRRVLVMGAGKIALRLASLVGDEFSFTIIDPDRAVCDRIRELCPAIKNVYCGDARDIDTLNDINISSFDAFVALSQSSEANILACLTAKEAGVMKSIAEVEDLQYISLADGLNIGTVVNKKLLASSSIFQLMLDNDSSTSKCLALTDAEVAELEVRPGSKITRAMVKDLRIPHGITLAGLIRDGKGMLVSGSTTILPGDHVVAFCLAGSLSDAENLFK